MINAAIYGIGRWGQNLVKSVQGNSDKINFVTGITRTPDNHADFGSEMSLSISDDYDAVLDDENIDAVVLATVHSHHAEQIKLAAGAGKHVFCEKPLALTRNDAEEAAQAALEAEAVFEEGANPDADAATADGAEGAEAPGALFDLARGIGAPAGLKDIGMPETGLDQAADEMMENQYANAAPYDRDRIRTLLDDAFAGRRP